MKDFGPLMAAAVLVAVSCTLQEPSFPVGDRAGECTYESYAPEDEAARSSLSPGYSVCWSAGDRIDIVGEKTRTQGVLSTLYDGGRRALFRAGGISPSDATLLAFYPPRPSDVPAQLLHADGSFELSIPSVQDGSFASANYCVARLEDGNRFRFRNLTAVVRFTIGDEALARSVFKIVLQSASGEYVAGRMNTDMDSLADKWPDDPSRTITIVPSSLAAGEPVYAAILPGTYESGLTLRLYDWDERLLKTYPCPMRMELQRGMVVELGDVPLPAESADGFSENFRRCFGKGGNDGVFDATYIGTRLGRDNSDMYCDNKGWDFRNVSVASGCVEFTAPDGSNAWMLTPPLGIDGSATLHLKASYYYGAYFGLNFKVVGDGRLCVNGSRVPTLMTFTGKTYNQMYDSPDIYMSGLSRDSRLMISASYTSRHHSYIDDIRIVPGAPEFDYLYLERSSMDFPAEGGTCRISMDRSAGVRSMYTGAAPFTDIQTGKDIYVNGKLEVPGAYVISNSGGTYLYLEVPRNTCGRVRQSIIHIYSSGPTSLFTITQDAL